MTTPTRTTQCVQDVRLGGTVKRRIETIALLEERLGQARYASLAARWDEARAKLATETLRRIVQVPSMCVNIDSYLANASLPCEQGNCGSVRYLDQGLCERHFVSLSTRGDLHRRIARWREYAGARDEVRLFLSHPSNRSNPTVLAAASALKGWVAGPPLPIARSTAGHRAYLKVREAISVASPKPSDVLAAVVGMLIHEGRINAAHDPLIDPMRQDWTYAGATLVGRALMKLAWQGGERETPITARGNCRRLLAQSLPEVSRLTILRLASALEGERRAMAVAKSAGTEEFVSPSTGLLITITNPPIAKEARAS